MTIRPYAQHDERGVLEVWRQCGLVVPQNDPVADIRRGIGFAELRAFASSPSSGRTVCKPRLSPPRRMIGAPPARV